jgi:hypothetical protein
MEQERRIQRNRSAAIRKGDHGAYTALRWVSILFKSAAVFLAVAIFAEFIAGIRADGWVVMPFLLGELARATVLGVILWAGGDLVRLLLQIGRDLRAERILLARIAHRTPGLEWETKLHGERLAGNNDADRAAIYGAQAWGREEASRPSAEASRDPGMRTEPDPGEAAA